MHRLKTLLRRMVASQLEARVKQLIKQNNLKVVAVTGSVGKTGTKLAVAEVLRQKYKVLAHEGNFNSEIGLPLSLFEVDVPESLVNPLAWMKVLDTIDAKLKQPYPYDVVVLEMGADRPGEIRHFMSYIKPDIGIVTAIAPAHLEGFGSVDAIATEKMALAHGSTHVLLNAEDERVMTEAKSLGAVQTYGVEKGETHWKDVTRGEDMRLAGTVVMQEGEARVQTAFIGRHSLSMLAAAAAVGEELALTAAQVEKGLEKIQPFAGRMQVLAGTNDSVLIDDTYNSSPRATTAALETLYELPGKRKIAILGSMNELGDQEERAHREVGKVAAKVDLLITIGNAAGKYLVAGAAAAGLKAERIHDFTSPYAAGRFLKDQLQSGDVVLAKGSQNGVFAEEAVALLLKSSADTAKLVRQSPAWEQRKHKQFGVN